MLSVKNVSFVLTGLFYGPILRRFSYRKVSIVGSLLIFTGVALTSFARSFLEFLLFYGIIMCEFSEKAGFLGQPVLIGYHFLVAI